MKKFKKVIFIIILIAIFSTITFFIGKQIGLNTDTSSTTTTITEETVGTQTITQTLTGSGEVDSANTEKLSISTSLYFETMCVEDDDTVKEGENILKYTNGTYLTAPYDCVIISNSVPETENKATSDNYIEIKDLTNLTTTLSINENEIANVTVGQEVSIVLTADETKTYTGKITKIDSVGTYASSGTTFSAVVDFENDGNAKLGMSVSCTVTLEEKKDVIAVSIDAVQTTSDKKYVIVVKDDKTTENVEVETGISNDNYVEITSGLIGGEKIQVVTTTTQSTIRNSSSKDSSSGMGSSSKGQDTQGMSDRMEQPSGGSQMPSMGGGQGTSGN